MAEGRNGRMTFDQPTGTAPSTADVKAAIRETRQKLADHVALTADHVHRIFTTPGSVETEAPVGGAAAAAIKTIAVAGRARRVWIDAKGMGGLRRAAIGGMMVVVGAALVRWTRRH
jgi:hypothetical protein